jgi:hypothetical protein
MLLLLLCIYCCTLNRSSIPSISLRHTALCVFISLHIARSHVRQGERRWMDGSDGGGSSSNSTHTKNLGAIHPNFLPHSRAVARCTRGAKQKAKRQSQRNGNDEMFLEI